MLSMTQPLAPLALAFAQQCAQWAAQLGADAAACQRAHSAAGAVAAAAAEGHVCLPLEQWPEGCDAAGLLATGIVAEAQRDTPAPLLLDRHQRLYLARHYHQEQRLARALHALAQHPPTPPGSGARSALLSLFPPGSSRGQQLAAAQALCSSLCVISGGPGTGKTTTVANLLACLLADQSQLRIALAAPTGKAAARLMESLASRAAHLPSEVSARLPREASTVHRLLGIHPHAPKPRHHRDNPLPVDVQVVDEASMLDLSLATRLVEAVPRGARLILLGDKDQLAAVEAGAVFSELSLQAGLSPARGQLMQELTGASATDIALTPAPFPLQDCVAWLSESYRFGRDSALGQLAAAMVAGEAGQAMALLQGQHSDLVWSSASGESLGEDARHALAAPWQPYVSAVQAGQPAAVFAALETFRILCARRSGLRGVDQVNALLEKALRPALSDGSTPPAQPHYRGRPLLITRNDPATQLFNGDIGVLLPHEGALAACFPDSRGGYRWLPLARLPAHDTAFAMTIHKSQGSEFDRVCILLPGEDGPLLTRELIYTAVTRARRGIQLHAAFDILESCIQRRTRRYSGLADRLEEVAQGDFRQ